MSCSLCGLSLPRHPILDADTVFCCHGCHAVYQILSAKDALSDFREHPIFKQAVQAGLISNTQLLAELRKKQDAAPQQVTEKLYLEVGEMWCPSCAELIRLILLQERGVVNCVVDYATDLAVIEFTPLAASKEQIKKRIAALGYVPHSLDAPERAAVSNRLYLRFAIAAFCSLNVMMFAYPLYATYFDFDDQGYGALFSWLSLAASLPVVTYCAWPIFRRGWTALLSGIVGMEALVSVGVLSAFVFSVYDLLRGGTLVYFDSMTVVVVFVLLGKIIESKAKFSAKSALIRLHKGVPKRGRKMQQDGSWSFVPVKLIAPGDLVRVLTGEKVVLDGVVKSGGGTCDESLMTGESMPVIKREGDRVLAGSLLQQGHFDIAVTSTSEETALHRILQLCENDIGHKSAYVRAVDPIVKIFVPFVLAFSVLVFVLLLSEGVEEAFLRTMSILLISCPCAIGIAAPLAESHLMHALTKLGVIVRNRGALSFLGRETTYVFDKTGTVTRGKFEVLSGLEGLGEAELGALKGMTMLSTHPIALAISSSLDSAPSVLDSIEEYAGKGICALLQNEPFYLGSRLFLQQHGIKGHLADSEKTTVYFARGTHLLASIVLGDQIRPDAPETVKALSPAKTILLSGDSERVVAEVARACGFGDWFAEAAPLKKRELVDTLKSRGEVVCVLGDGINDAPALTAAHVGISVLSAADLSIQVSDILLTTDKLSVLPQMGSLARKARRIIKQNLFWAFFYNVIGIILATAGVLSPIFAAAAMVVSSLMVLFNAQRLSKHCV